MQGGEGASGRAQPSPAVRQHGQEVPGQELHDGIRQGRERVCTCTWAQAEPGPRFSWSPITSRYRGSTILLSPSSPPVPGGAGPQLIQQAHAGARGTTGLGGDGSCSHVSEQGPCWGELMYVQELGQEETQGPGSPSRALIHRPGSLPGVKRQRGESGSGRPAPRHGRSPSFSGEEWEGRGSVEGLRSCCVSSMVQDWAASVWWSQRLRTQGCGVVGALGVSALPRARPVCQRGSSLTWREVQGGLPWVLQT